MNAMDIHITNIKPRSNLFSLPFSIVAQEASLVVCVFVCVINVLNCHLQKHSST